MFGDLLVRETFFDRYLKPGVPLPNEARPSWRHLFSTRLQMKAGFDLIEQWIAQTRDADLGPYSEENRRWNEVYEENRIRTNVFASEFLGARADARYGRQRRSILRLLRTAVHYYATGNFPDLDDPFGGKLRHAETEISVRIWGVGNNGVDDGGKGDWPNTGHEDISIEIPRRP
jgi:hypothetical protein